MAVSYNEDVKVGNSTFHVQTEYYRKSGKVVSNIFKDGLAVKRLEREIDADSDINSAVSEFHRYVVERLRRGVKKRGESQPGGRFYLPKEVEEELLQTIYPYFGVASSLVVDEALTSSSTVDEFLRNLLDGLPENMKGILVGKLKPLLQSLPSSTSAEPVRKTSVETEFEIDEERKEKILQVLSEYFGIMALPVLEEALEKWGGARYQELVDLIVSHVEDEKEREELHSRLMFL